MALYGLVTGVGVLGFTPLCPAGHLPLKGGDQQVACGEFLDKALRFQCASPSALTLVGRISLTNLQKRRPT
jgi:hypothetical protein